MKEKRDFLVNTLDPPKIGEIRRGWEIYRKDSQNKYQYARCAECKEPRWTILRRGEVQHPLCSKCANRKSRLGRRFPNGYQKVRTAASTSAV